MKATRESYGEELANLMDQNEKIVVFDADLSKSTKTILAKNKYPNRHFNAGIAEANMVTMAGGMATTGKIVVVSSFAMFLAGRAFEQIRNSVCYPKLNVKLCATHAGITVGEDGASHQSIEDLAIMRAIPNMVVISPADEIATKKALRAIIDYPGPCYLRLGRIAVPSVYNEDFQFKIGDIYELKSGKDATIFATGYMVHIALEVAKKFKGEIDFQVIDVPTLKPINKSQVLSSISDKKMILTLEEHSTIGGLGSTIKEAIAWDNPKPVLSIGIDDCFGESGKPKELLEKFGLTVDEITKKIRENNEIFNR